MHVWLVVSCSGLVEATRLIVSYGDLGLSQSNFRPPGWRTEYLTRSRALYIGVLEIVTGDHLCSSRIFF